MIHQLGISIVWLVTRLCPVLFRFRWMNEAAPISSSHQEQANMFSMMVDHIALALTGETGFPGSCTEAGEHVETLSNAVQPNTAAGH